jgi:hypothetical protein
VESYPPAVADTQGHRRQLAVQGLESMGYQTCLGRRREAIPGRPPRPQHPPETAVKYLDQFATAKEK